MGKPFIKLIRSPRAYYFFDVNKNQIVRIPEGTYHNLEQILNGESVQEDGTVRRLREMGYLSDFHVKEMEHPLTERLPELLDSKMKLLILQITQSCNFRCSYCIYSNDYNERQRGHSAKSMSMETAKAAIDYFTAHSAETASVTIAFYGGEPLLEFEKMRQLIAYAKEKMPERQIRFTFTTNASLLTPEITAYCAENNIDFMVSIDGPEKIQNINRRFAADGKGSYRQVTENMRYVQEHYPEYFKKLSVNMVMDQQNDYDEIESLYNEPVWGDLDFCYSSYIDDVYSLEKTVFTEDFHKKNEYHKFLGYLEYMETGEYTGRNVIVKQDINYLKNLKDKFTERKSLPEKSSHSGPCVPGQTKLFVNVEGDFYACERVSEKSECMKIGSVRDGINLEAAERLLNICRLGVDSCRECWAFAHCTQCIRHVDDGGRLSGALKQSYCKGVRRGLKQAILDYIMVKECGMGI